MSPKTTDRITDPGVLHRRKSRRRKLVLLWSLTTVLLAAQAATVAVSLRHRQEASRSPNPWIYLEQARQLASAGKYQEAVDLLSGFVDKTSSPQLLALANAEKRRIQAAERLKIARRLLREGKRQSARHHIEGVLDIYPDHPVAVELLEQLASAPDAQGPGAVDGAISKVVRRPPKPLRSRRNRRRRRRATSDKRVHVDDVTVPRKLTGSPTRGKRVFELGCGVCHGRTTRRVDHRFMTAKQWIRYFASGRHGAHNPYRSYFTRAELASVKAYLVSRATGAGSR